jgi:putative transposase
MAQRTTKFIKGEFYHIYNRGCGRGRIFRSDENYRFLQKLLREYSAELAISIIAYSLMPNHYHLVLRQDGQTSAGDFVQRVFNRYSKAYNKMFHRTGTLFEGPFRSVQIDSEAYLVHLCRYVHRNPLDAGLVTTIQDWGFSDYFDWIEPTDVIARPGIKLFPAYFGSPSDYERFVLNSEIPPDILSRLTGLD